MAVPVPVIVEVEEERSDPETEEDKVGECLPSLTFRLGLIIPIGVGSKEKGIKEVMIQRGLALTGRKKTKKD